MSINYFKTFTRLCLTVAAFAMSGCSGNASNATNTNNTDNTDAPSDMASEVSVSGENPAPKTEKAKASAATPRLSFANADEAIEWMKKSPDADKYMAGILPDMARDQLNYCTKLLNSKYSRFLICDKATMHVYLYDRYGCEIERFGMACARNFGTKHRRGDNRTPEGFFSAEGIYNSTDWLYTDDSGYTSPAKGVYGPKFIRIDVPNTRSIGIHGTNAPGSIGRRASHGCMRLKNADIKRLATLVEKGMPIIISPGPKDIAVNEREKHPVASVAVVPGQPRARKGDMPYTPSAKAKSKESPAVSDSVPSADSGSDPKPTVPEQSAPAAPSEPVAPSVPETPSLPAE